MPLAGPWYFAWVDENTAFNPAVHNVMNEYIFSIKRTLKEGDKPTAELVIRNPHIGLLNSARKQWAWISRHDGSTGGIEPFFYGRLIAAPKDIFKELMTINLIAWPINYVAQRQAIAEEIKIAGPYDPVFIEVPKRDDPDTLLEAVSGLYHVDPVTHTVTISDILDGEDGNVDIDADEHLYDEFSAEFDQTNSLTAILMDATVSWNQTGQGFIDFGSQSINTYAGDAIMSEWPKPLANLGGGYTVVIGSAIDGGGVDQTVMASANYNWTNKSKEHEDGDTLSVTQSVTKPMGGGAHTPTFAGGVGGSGMLEQIATWDQQQGFLDPYGVDAQGDPSPTNVPPHFNVSYLYCPQWTINTQLGLSYRDLERQRTERIQMILKSDLQSIIVRPEVEQNSETIVKNGSDVGVPILNVLNWTTIAGQVIAVDTIIFPDHPTLPGRRSLQICTTGGTAGIVQPTFSDVPGVTTNDGTVVWSSLGTASPPETANDWPAATNIGLGTVILPRRHLSIPRAAYIFAGLRQFPPVGTHIGVGTVLDNNSICSQSGIIGGRFNSATFNAFTNPDGKTHYVCVQAGKTAALFNNPSFNPTLHAQTTDGSVVWAAIGSGDIPVGGTPGDVWARSYFDTARGNRSIEYLIAIMRARARLKARAVSVSFKPIDPFGLGLSLTTRKTVSLHDTRLSGGVATGKIIQVDHTCDGHTGREECRVEIGCAIGKDTAIETVPGNPTYCNGYSAGYRYFTDTVVTVQDHDDVGYTPPQFVPNDDGLVFPLTKIDVVISEAIKHAGDQQGAVQSALADMAKAAQLAQLASFSNSLDFSADIQRKIIALGANSINVATAGNPIWYDLMLKPLTGWQFNNFYIVQLTNLVCAKGIDLEGASTP